METFSALLALCARNSPVTGIFPAQRPVTRSFGVFFDLRLDKRLSKQSWRGWFETPSCSLWHHCNPIVFFFSVGFMGWRPRDRKPGPLGPTTGKDEVKRLAGTSSYKLYNPHRQCSKVITTWTQTSGKFKPHFLNRWKLSWRVQNLTATSWPKLITNDGSLWCIILYNALCTMHAGETMHCKACYKTNLETRLAWAFKSPACVVLTIAQSP